LAGLLTVPATAHAAPSWWGASAICTSGGFNVCASVDILGSNSNMLKFRVYNMAPTYGISHVITAFGFYHLGTAWTGNVSGLTVKDDGGNTVTGWTTRPPDNTEIKSNGSGYDIELAVDASGVSDGIGDGEFYTFTIQLDQEFLFTDDTQLRWHSQNIGPGGQYSIKCDTGWTDDEAGSSYPPCTVVPEPVTMFLLGTGLAGMGGVGVLRRRRNGVDVENS
jgi:hypothetical protein